VSGRTSRERHTLTLLCGLPGSGKTEQIVRRAVGAVERGVAGERVLMLAPSRNSAAALAARVQGRLDGSPASGEPAVFSAEAFCAGLLRSEAARAGLDPFFAIANHADRLWMLLGHAHRRTRSPDVRARGSRTAREERADPASTPASARRAIAQIDRLKRALVDAERYAAWAGSRPARGESTPNAASSFAAVYREHERLLAERDALDEGALLLRSVDLLREPGARARLRERYEHLLIDDVEDASAALLALIDLLADAIGEVTLAGDEHALASLAASRPAARVVALAPSFRCPPRILDAARGALLGAAEPAAASAGAPPAPAPHEGEVVFWRCAEERAEVEAVVAEIERLIEGGGAGAPTIGVLVGSLEREGRSLVGALKERAIPYRVRAASELFECADVRDLLAWLRVLDDPLDRNATIRLLMRPLIELRPIELARAIQLSRRRKLDMPSALAAALDAPQFPPEARERIAGFLGIYDELAPALDELRPEELVHRLIVRSALRPAHVLAGGAEGAETLVRLGRVERLAEHFARLMPRACGRDFAAYICDAAATGLSFEELVGGGVDAPGRGGAGAAVQVMSLEASRGSEFDHVFVIGLGRSEASAPPEKDSGGGWEEMSAELLAAPDRGRAEWPAGARRSLYLALTRARTRVVLLHAARDGAFLAQSALPAAEDARRAVGARWEDRAPTLDPTQALHAAARVLSREAMEEVARIGGRLGELRLDTGEDISHGVVRYLELLKLAALLERPGGQSLAEALREVNARLLAACTPLEREMFESSPLDAALISAHGDEPELGDGSRRVPAAGMSSSPQATLGRLRDVPEDARLSAFLPRHGSGLMLSASDIESYRACPLRYKFARVLRIPAEPTPQQRFGIMVHKVLERYHSEWEGMPYDVGSTLPTLMRLLDTAWRRAGFRESPAELALLERARTALARYHRQLADQPGRPVWFERSFSFAVGDHQVRGRVDRVDRIAGGGYELIDYKTGHAKTPAQLEGDLQLALYALAARRAWDVTATRLAYYYVLDNRKVPLAAPHDSSSLRSVEETIVEAAEGIRALRFVPTPSYSVCAGCDFLSLCPAAEA
jgi:DNA helicase-2/ATP-dependent DNA helicase PcrA